MHKSPQRPGSDLLQERTSRKAAEDIWICLEDQALFNQVQDRGTRLYLSS